LGLGLKFNLSPTLAPPSRTKPAHAHTQDLTPNPKPNQPKEHPEANKNSQKLTEKPNIALPYIKAETLEEVIN